MMRSDWLEAFEVFASSMNFTAAARELNISQPALHVKIGKLAEQIDQPLYYKTGRSLSLTPAGEQLVAFARRQNEQTRNFLDDLKSGCSSWPVVLCAGEGAYLYILGEAITGFVKNSRHKLSLLTGNSDRTLEVILSGKAHIGVTSLHTAPAGLITEPLLETQLHLIVPSRHRFADLKKISLPQLNGETLIVPPANRPHRTLLNQMLMDAKVEWTVGVEANGWELMMHFVKLGVGLAIVNGTCKIPRGLRSIPVPALPKIQYQLLYRKGALEHNGAQELRETILRDAVS